MTKITIGLIGIGDIVSSHLSALKANPEYELIAICDHSAEKLKIQTANLGVDGYTDYRDMLAKKPDVVLIGLPHNLHYPVALEALEAGCHVLMEKPVVISMEEANGLIAAADKANKIVIPTESSYWLPIYRTARKIVESGKLGKLLFGNIINHRYYFVDSRPDWFLKNKTSGGGQFMNIGMHRMAAIRCILGDDYKEKLVTASVHRIHKDRDIEAATKAMVMYEGGAAITYEECGYFKPPPELQKVLHFVFEHGMLGVTDSRVWTSDKNGDVTDYPLLPNPEGGPYGALYGQMLEAIRGNPHYPTLNHGVADIRTALAAYASAEKQDIVNLSNTEWLIDKECQDKKI